MSLSDASDSGSDTLYDPPITKPRQTPLRGRSASFSAGGNRGDARAGPEVEPAAYDPPPLRSSVRRSASLPRPRPDPGSQFTQGERELETPLVRMYDDIDRLRYATWQRSRQDRVQGDLETGRAGGGVGNDLLDEEEDRRAQRPGRQSRGQESPVVDHTADMDQFLSQCFELTHAIDELENNIDQILAMRNKIASLKPHDDVGQVSLHADMTALASLTTASGKKIVALETWLVKLHEWCWGLRKSMKKGKSTATKQEIAEMKFQLSGAKLDFADAMDRIREGAWKEQERRQRTRIWMARHIRTREDDIEDDEVGKMLKAAELGAADGVAQHDVISYAGLWALRNPFTELAELTHRMAFLHDDLDTEIVNTVIHGDSKRSTRQSTILSPPPGPQLASQQPMLLYKFNQNQLHATELNFEYGLAREIQLQRARRRKAMVIALLLAIIAGLLLCIWLAHTELPVRLGQ